MSDKPTRREGNALLALLPPHEAQRIHDRAELVTLASRDLISDSERPIEYVYFPTTAVLSVLSVMTDGSAVETAVVGNEGMAPLSAFHDVPSAAEQIIAQVPGESLRISASAFSAILRDAPALVAALHRFSQALFTLAAQTSGCNRKHSVVQRCARWLLLSHDRVPGNEIELTHLFLSQMLGVRRSSVTVAAEALRAAGAIAYTRGAIAVVDRKALQARACECYEIVRATYDRLLQGIPSHSPLANLKLSEGDKSLAHAGDREKRDAPLDVVAAEGVTRQALAEFGAQLRGARERSAALKTQIEKHPQADDAVRKANEELSIALEQLQVAEEELRVQMETLDDLRYAMEMKQEEWRTRLDGLPDAFIETDEDDTIVEMNRAAEELLGRKRASVIGKPLVTLVPESDRRNFRDMVTLIRRQGSRVVWNAVVGGPNAEGRAVEVSASARRRGAKAADTAAPATEFAGARWLMRPRARTPERGSAVHRV